MPRILMLLLLLMTTHVWAQGPIEIIRATYGAGRTQTDVTEKVRAAMVNGAIQLTVRGENLGGDPMPNTQKTLTVIYSQNGARHTVRVKDFDTLSLGTNFRITKALYGDGRRMRDVTELLNTKVTANRIELPINNANLGGDPAPAVRKSLTVDYEFNGASATVKLAEGETLVLPPASAATPSAPVSSLRVIRATYGGGRRGNADVTQAIAARVVNDTLEIPVSSTSLNIDPAPGVAKALTVVYEYKGQRLTATAKDGETLRLNTPAPAQAQASTLRILRATYGGGRRASADVTNAVAARVANDALEFPVSTANLNVDPAPGVAKTLTVDYEYNGQRQTATAKDGETLRLNAPAQASALRILRATYGSGRRASADVTNAVAARVANDTLEIPVSSTSLNIDPAPGAAKTLTVEYEYKGQRQTASANDGETLRLNSPAPAQGSALRILRATYSGGRRTADVTSAVAARVANDMLELTVNGNTLGADPAPGTVKTLTIEYEVYGQRQTATARDSELVILPRVTSFAIYRATYGAQGRTLDATRAVTARVNNNRLELPITGDALGGDPAPGILKTLTVEYELNGHRRTATAQDGETLRLPGGGTTSGPAKGPVVPAQATDAIRPRTSGICVYRQPNYGGEAVCGSSQTALSGGFRSLRLNGASAVDVYEQTNFSGRSQTISTDTPDLLQVPGSFWRYDSAAMIQSLRAR